MADFINLNLWMFLLVGLLGYLLCFFRYQFAYWIVPVIAIVCVAYLVNPVRSDDGFQPVGALTWFRIGFSMLFALLLPVAGAVTHHRDDNPKQNLP